MNKDLELLLGIIDQQGKPTGKEALEAVQPEWINHLTARSLFEACRHLSRAGRPVVRDNILSTVALKDGEIDWFDGLLEEKSDLNVDLALLAQELKQDHALVQAKKIIAPLDSMATITSNDLVAISRELALIGATLESKRLEMKCSGGVIDKLKAGEPVLPYEKTLNVVNFGLPGLDDRLRCGRGSMGIIAAITSAGKTTLSVQATANTALRGKRVLLVSLEMSHQEMDSKIHGYFLQEDSFQILANRIQRTYSPEQEVALGKIYTICPGSGQNWNQLESRIRDLHGDEAFDCVIVDYFSLLEPPDVRRGANSAQMFGEISKSARRLAQDLDIAVVMVSQFNRNPEECEEPKLKDLRETGQLENDSTWALLLWNTKEVIHDNPIVRVRIAKNRFGPRWGLHNLEADRRTGRFHELKTVGNHNN